MRKWREKLPDLNEGTGVEWGFAVVQMPGQQSSDRVNGERTGSGGQLRDEREPSEEWR
ncbi:uncharacterized protein TrAtP1_004582 [Trichoderma atroviride]|uniref:uncharacterized protein n=1 Tax=Hypocrea atroviridis TaxID=63577 RepID=UPI00331E3345|nr:hypothetical protein TrAtP1_004582 [Trichoderma atroviride]